MTTLPPNFDMLAPNSRLWIYASVQPFTPTQLQVLNNALTTFVNGWKAHGNELKASYAIAHQQFILIAVDEQLSEASGCSIDASVRVIKQLEADLNITLMDRSLVYYITATNTVDSFKFTQAEQLIANGTISASTLVFDNTISALAQLTTAWQVPANNTWLSRYLTSVTSN